jgi:hypothetical protein
MQEKNKYKYTYTVKDEFMRVHNNLTCRIKWDHTAGNKQLQIYSMFTLS